MIWIVSESQQQHLRHPIHLQIRNCVSPPPSALARTCPNKVTTCTPCCPTATWATSCCTDAAAPGSGGTCHSQFASSFVFWPLKVYLLQTGLWQRSVVSCHDGFQLFPLFRRARFPHLKSTELHATQDMLRKCEICPPPNYTCPGRPRRRSSASSIHDEVAGLRKLLFQRPPSDLAALCKLCARFSHTSPICVVTGSHFLLAGTRPRFSHTSPIWVVTASHVLLAGPHPGPPGPTSGSSPGPVFC